MGKEADKVGEGLIEDLRMRAKYATWSIATCLKQLDEADLWWRPHPTHNSVANLIHHVCGNLWQFVIAGVCQGHFTRTRDAEFARRTPVPKQELLELLTNTADAVDRCLAELDTRQLFALRHIQGSEQTVLTALMSSIIHFHGHADQCLYIARERLGDAYDFGHSPPPPPPEEVSGSR